MSSSVDDKLLSEVKNYLDITWDDEAGDKKITGFIDRGIKRINELCGHEFNYSEGTDDAAAKELLLNYVMYARSDALDDFFKNYAIDINRLQLASEVTYYAEKTKSGTL